MDKFKNKYRNESTRLQSWDYGWNAAYFITICTQNREHFFGEIVKKKNSDCNEMKLNEIGQIVQNEWIKTPDIRPDMNLKLGNFVVMPDHFHAIIIIGNNEYNTNHPGCRDAMHCVPTTGAEHCVPTTGAMHCVPTTGAEHCVPTTTTKNKFGPQSKNLASIIRGFKSSVTINARKIHADFAWQSRFYDHIIRNNVSFERIQTYIENNPKNWGKEKMD